MVDVLETDVLKKKLINFIMEWLKQQLQRYTTTEPQEPPPSPPEPPGPEPSILPLSPPIIQHSHLHQPPGGIGSSQSSLVTAPNSPVVGVKSVNEKYDLNRYERRFSDSSYSSTVSSDYKDTPLDTVSGRVNPAYVQSTNDVRTATSRPDYA